MILITELNRLHVKIITILKTIFGCILRSLIDAKFALIIIHGDVVTTNNLEGYMASPGHTELNDLMRIYWSFMLWNCHMTKKDKSYLYESMDINS